MSIFRRITRQYWLLLLVQCNGADFSVPPNTPSYALSYPPGVSGNLPQSATIQGGQVDVHGVVSDYRGRPVEGVEVFWDRAGAPNPAGPTRKLTDPSGRATFTWRFGTTIGSQAIRAYVVGALGSPLEYRAFVIPGKGGPPPGP